MQHESWYQGTADAVRRNIPYVTRRTYDLVADPLRRPALPDGLPGHDPHARREQGRRDHRGPAGGRGRGAVVRDHADPGRRQGHRLRGEAQDRREARSGPHRPDLAGEAGTRRPTAAPTWPAWASTCSTRKALVELLESSNATDFGQEILPQTITNHRVQAHLFDGYWEDIGTVGAFHQANIDLTATTRRSTSRSASTPIFTRPRYLPCSRISRRDGQEQPDQRRLRHRPGRR